MKKNNEGPTFEGLAFVYQLMLDSIRYFGKVYQLNMNQTAIVLTIAYYKELTLKELCAHTDLPNSTASQIVAELVNRKILTRRIPEENRRTTRLSLDAKFAKRLNNLSEDKEFQRLLSENMSEEQGMKVVHKLAELMAAIHGK